MKHQGNGGKTVFQINDTVMYGNAGVCRIVDIRPESFTGETRTYYVLKPVSSAASTIYCPVDNQKIKMRRLLSEEEIYQLIRTMPDTRTAWIEDEQERRETFGEIVKHGSHRELVQLIKTLYYKREERLAAGKKFHLCDERIMHEAEQILYGEFAHVLHLRPEEVLPFITGQLEQAAPPAQE